LPEPPIILGGRLYRQDWDRERPDGPHVVWLHPEESLATAYMWPRQEVTTPESPIGLRIVLPANHPINLRGAMRCTEDDVQRPIFTGD